VQAFTYGVQEWKYHLTKSTNDADEFAGRRVLVTSGTDGVGKTIADRFLQGHATVVTTARRQGPEPKNLICECYVRNCED
jgi:3-oxoacyl-ACP reductase-like protein